MSHTSSVFHSTRDIKITAKKAGCLFHIASVQFLSDIGAADLSVSVHFFGKDFCNESVFFSVLFQEIRRSFSLVAKPEILPHRHIRCMKGSYQNLFYEIFGFHMFQTSVQRTFEKHIHTKSFQQVSSFSLCKDHFPVRDKSKHYRRCPGFFFLLQDPPYQLSVSPVYPVKFSHRDRTVCKSGKLTVAYRQIFHNFTVISLS